MPFSLLTYSRYGRVSAFVNLSPKMMLNAVFLELPARVPSSIAECVMSVGSRVTGQLDPWAIGPKSTGPLVNWTPHPGQLDPQPWSTGP